MNHPKLIVSYQVEESIWIQGVQGRIQDFLKGGSHI